MVKILSEGLLPPDDPMFSSGLETFSVHKTNRSTTTSPKQKAGVHPVNLPETEEDAIRAGSMRVLKAHQQAKQQMARTMASTK